MMRPILAGCLLLPLAAAVSPAAHAQEPVRGPAPAMVPFVGIGQWAEQAAGSGAVRSRGRLIGGIHGDAARVGRFRLGFYAASSVRARSCDGGCTPAGTFYGLSLDRSFDVPGLLLRPYLGGGIGAFDIGFSYASPDVRAGVDLDLGRSFGARIEARQQWLLGIGGPDAQMLLLGARLALF